ncbi:TetR/AcrR family transcriptional regulator [Nevskia sp.]|uniref:TetR/AcrR family transcriptional regulator n=1 Tax=Nevskia sp. TaxID=1929292 RepID=UPI0026014D72|nr:TetR/AcrR family transcriptional regulator [Nevskia sp.]
MEPIELRRLEEKERRREDILDAAEIVFAEKGFDDAKMDDIARAARVSRALLYIYFKDKRELQFALCLRGMDLLRQRFSEARKRNGKGVDQIKAIGRAYIGFVQEFPVYFNAMARAEAQHTELEDESSVCHRMMLAGRAVHMETITALLAGQKDGSLRADLGDPLRVAMTLWGFTHGVAQLAVTKGEIFAHEGIALNAFISDAIDMATRSIAS